jgi:phosphatidylglycerol---prolipoprotein diacylglyceryl transferase
MYPRLFTLPTFDAFGRHLGPLTLYTYGVLLAVAFLAGLQLADRQAKRDGLDASRIIDLGVYVLIAGLLGAKAMLIVVEWRHYFDQPSDLWTVIQSGGVFYGGLIAALPVAWWYVTKHGLPGWRTADALAPGVALGQSIGRLGCLAAGCCHGKAAQVPWAIRFTDIYAARTVGTPMDTPLHPTQIYESIATAVICAILLRVAKKRRFEGQVTLTYLLLYAVARFGIEFYRGDAARGFLFGGVLSTSQFIAILMVLAAGALWPLRSKANAPAAADGRA